MWTAPHAIRLTTITLWHFDAAEWAPICPLRSDRVRCSASQRNDALCHSRRIDTLAMFENVGFAPIASEPWHRSFVNSLSRTPGERSNQYPS